MKKKYFNSIINRIKPFIDSYILIKEKNQIRFEFIYQNETYEIRLSYLRYMFFYKKSSAGNLIMEMSDTDKNFCPVFDFKTKIEDFDAEKYLFLAKLHADNWSI